MYTIFSYEYPCSDGPSWNCSAQSITIHPYTVSTGPAVSITGSLLAIFKLFFTAELLHMIVEQTNSYAQQVMEDTQYASWMPVTEEEILAFLGFSILMGLNPLPAIRDYWKRDSTFHYAPIAERISRDRFLDLLRYLHFVDATVLPIPSHANYDRLCRVRPVIEVVRRACRETFQPGAHQAIDEAMIRFKGRSSLKQYMPMKPTKRGIKVWVRSDSVTGYVCDLEVYTGRQGDTAEVGLGGNVVRRLSRDLVGTHCHLYMDNFFSGVPLFTSLLDDGIYACGTFRTNRKWFPRELLPFTKAGLPTRGDYRWRQDGNLVATVWQDSKPVVVLSTNSNPDDTTTVRRKQKDGSVCDVVCPSVIAAYNQYMGGVDMGDQYRGYYNVRTKSQKCYRYIFWFLFEVSLLNTYILQRYSPMACKAVITYKDFRVSLAKSLIGTYNGRKRVGRPSTSARPPRRLRVSHFPQKCNTGRCHYCHTVYHKQRHTTWFCQECGRKLCHTGVPTTDCFLKFHVDNELL